MDDHPPSMLRDVRIKDDAALPVPDLHDSASAVIGASPPRSRAEDQQRQPTPDAPAPAQTAPAALKEPPPNDRLPASSQVPSIIIAVVVVAIASLSIWYLVRPEPLLVQGEVDATRFDLAARVDGRVAEISVQRGQDVTAGAVLVRIDKSGDARKE